MTAADRLLSAALMDCRNAQVGWEGFPSHPVVGFVLTHGNVDTVGNHHRRRGLGDHAVLVPGHAGTGQAVHAQGGELLLQQGAGLVSGSVAVDAGSHAGVVQGVDYIIAVGSELVGQLAAVVGLELLHEGNSGIVGGVGVKGSHQHQALSQCGVKAFHVQDAVHTVAAEEGWIVPQIICRSQKNATA